MSKFSVQTLVTGKDGVGYDDPSIQEFIASRKGAFVAEHGSTSRYNTSGPIAYDTRPGTVFILIRNAENNEIASGIRLLVSDAEKLESLPIGSHLNVETGAFPQNTHFIEFSIFITEKYKGQGLGVSMLDYIFSHAEAHLKPCVILAEAVAKSAHLLRKKVASHPVGISQALEAQGTITSSVGELAVFAFTDMEQDRVSLKDSIKVVDMKKSVEVSSHVALVVQQNTQHDRGQSKL